jgi:hypothetical protein
MSVGRRTEPRPGRVAWCCVLIASGLWGCAVGITGTREWFDTYGRSSLARRASFDLSCPEQQLHFAPLGSQGGGYFKDGDHMVVGVSGCGSQATYRWVDREWAMNNATKPGGTVTVKAPPATTE